LRVLLASPSAYRRRVYSTELTHRKIDIGVAANGLECLQKLRASSWDVLVIEANLLWGGAEGVLALMADSSELRDTPVILIGAGASASELYKLSKYSLQDFVSRFPRPEELAAGLAVTFALPHLAGNA
jgi:CheY-like chemotaxis protein